MPNTIESLGKELLINGIYEKKLVRFFKDHMESGDVYFDVGANIGAMGLPIARKKEALQYYGFEASPDTFEYLRANFEKNKVAHHQLFNCLVHETNGQEYRFYQSSHYGKNSLAPTYSKEYITVRSLSLDHFCEQTQIDIINWIKIDVQGFELYVFKGMKHLIQLKKIENIVFEFEYWAEEDADLEKGAAQQYLVDSGYELFDLSGSKLEKIITSGRAMIWAKPKSTTSIRA